MRKVVKARELTAKVRNLNSADNVLALMRDAVQQARRGKMSPADAKRFVEMGHKLLEAAAALSLARQMGMDIHIPTMEEVKPEAFERFRTKKVRQEVGTDKHGLPTEKRQVTVETAADDEDAEVEVGVALLR